MSIRDAIGDLSITLKALTEVPYPVRQQSRMANFSSWFGFGERFFLQAIDVGLQLEALGRPATADELAPMREAASECWSLLVSLASNSSYAFDYIGYEQGYFYGGASWSKLCVWRSASEFLAAMFAGIPDHDLAEEFSGMVDGMAAWGHELFKPLEAPEGMPARHWWWFAAQESDV